MIQRALLPATAAMLLAGAGLVHAQTETGPGGYVYEHQSPSITLVKPGGWTPPEPAKPEPETLRPIMPSDLYEDENIDEMAGLDAAIGRPQENALGPVLAEQRAEERRARIAAGEEPEQKLADEVPPEGLDNQTTAALPEAGENAEPEPDVEVIAGGNTNAPADSDPTSPSAQPAAPSSAEDAQGTANPDLSGMQMRL